MGLDSLVLGLVNDGMGHVLQWVQLQGRYNFEMLPGDDDLAKVESVVFSFRKL